MQQTPSIYRNEAWQARTMTQHGSAMLVPSNRIYMICGFLLVWVSALAWFLLHYSFTEKVTVIGYILSDQPSIAIGPKENTGTVSEVFAQNGDLVKQGEPLLSIRRPSQLLLGDFATSEQLKLLRKQLALISLNQEQRITELSEQQAYILMQDELAVQQASVLQEQALLLQERIQLSNTQVLKLDTLFAQQLISNETLTNAKQNLLSLQQQQSQLTLQISDVTSRRSQLNAQQSQIEQQLAQQSTQTQLNKLPLQQQIEQIKAQQSYTIYAPRDGVISNFHAQVGDDISRFNVLMKLSPEQESFVAMLAVPTSAAGFIAQEQEVSLRLDAFAYQKYGNVAASIANIASTVTLPNESQAHAVTISQPVFMVEATMQNAFVEAKGERIALKEGMTLQADVTLSQRSLLEWLLSPIYSIKGSL